ncbi:hypothetical protein RintRC_4434 [Richelia intracellularis]|nr:hypothetical protein RintRC_4434 [Richelia intracellularis]
MPCELFYHTSHLLKHPLILDATCAPIDISYPTDLGILNQARKQTERIIDSLSEQIKGRLDKKPRTYRELAIKDYIVVAKKSRPRHKQRSKAIKRQLQYIKINLSHIHGLISLGATLSALTKRQHLILSFGHRSLSSTVMVI